MNRFWVPQQRYFFIKKISKIYNLLKGLYVVDRVNDEPIFRNQYKKGKSWPFNAHKKIYKNLMYVYMI